MGPNPFVGVLYHWIGGLAAASFYIPYRGVQRWSWETYWLVGGVFSWIVAPLALAWALVPGFWETLHAAPARTLWWAYAFGVLWGLGGLTFGLAVRYLGIALGVAVALGYCAAFGTLVPPIFSGDIVAIAASTSGRVILAGVAACLVGHRPQRRSGHAEGTRAVTGTEGRNGPGVQLFEGHARRNLLRNHELVFRLRAGCRQTVGGDRPHATRRGRPERPLGEPAGAGGGAARRVHHELPVVRRAQRPQPLGARVPGSAAVRGAHGGSAQPASLGAAAAPVHGMADEIPLARNYLLSAAAGITWYFQFFFYSMGQTRMGRYEFSSWTLHMASIIIFSTLWGVALREWRGTSARTHLLIGAGLAVLIGSTVVVGYGNFLKSGQ